jgi:hypothetical protein
MEKISRNFKYVFVLSGIFLISWNYLFRDYLIIPYISSQKKFPVLLVAILFFIVATLLDYKRVNTHKSHKASSRTS